ncbi:MULTISPECIES: LAETG motif-containing sortase-dependent surface protein [unclassified Streptomyces]|uniref:LAETG motif-containing sortase-dependent surface protein n=1 Tax=unclassified Streptomyces TaxID=2593676 RepID=UPI0022AF0B35|nr:MULTISPECIES: LAETG motif-containing sortase-dependent surface protein [unclassified Streptomyces]MCZ4123924.1 LPXTG cell wall anchor domain-containing protein [Streptomyces sp. H39-S7]
MDKTFTTTLTGLPSKIVAGSGWHGLTIDVSNNSARSYQRVDFGAFAVAVGGKDFSDTSRHLKLQFKNSDTGAWQNVSLNEENPDFGGLGWTDVRAHEKFKLSLRIAADASTPAGFGVVIGIGAYADEKGNCVFSSGQNFYEFNILKANTKPGHVPDSKPQTGGTKPLPTVKPANTIQVTPEGRLAETGSSSAMPQLALAGGAAVAVGVGAMFIVRRRKASSAV